MSHLLVPISDANLWIIFKPIEVLKYKPLEFMKGTFAKLPPLYTIKHLCRFSYKQLSYFSRIVLILSFSTIGYVGLYVALVVYYDNPTEKTVPNGDSIFTAPYYNQPFFPNFFDILAMDAYTFEGICMIPALFGNARN
jgi:hypothetical protein